ncbi:MAG: hypothetical protein HY985_01345 [Magnetospirillum sp.]|nr:hypothetical protein [Magnetospirillum sp.]
MKHVLYLVQAVPTERDVIRFGMQALLQRGIAVTVLDLGLVLLPRIDRRALRCADHSGLRVIVCDRSQVVSDLLDGLAGEVDFAVCLIAGHHLSARILRPMRSLARLGIPYVLFHNTAVPGLGQPAAPESLLARTIRKLRSGTLVDSLVGRLPPAWLGVTPAAAVVTGGRRSRVAGPLIGSRTMVIPAHSADWETIRGLRGGPSRAARTAVFLDQFLPFHPDFMETGAARIPPGPYFAALSALFTRIEREQGLEVVIAAHPRSDYESRGGDCFGGRRLVRDTLAAIRDCRLVIAHHSTAIGFAAALGRPVLVITGEMIRASYPPMATMAHGYARALGRRLADFDAIPAIDLEAELTIDAAAYERFVDDYLKAPEAADKPLWDIVFDGISRCLNDRRMRVG